MRIREILDPECIVLDISGSSKAEILRQLAEPVARRQKVDLDRLVASLLQREETSTTAIADGIAIPHARLDTGDRVLCGLGRSSKGLDFQSVDGNPTQIFFVLVSPESHPSAHLRWLAHLAMMLKNPDFRRALIEAKTPEDVLSVIENEEKAIEKREASSEAT